MSNEDPSIPDVTNSSQSKDEKNTGVSKKILIIILVILLIAAASSGVYIWQHKKLTTDNARINTLDKKISSLSQETESLNKQLVSLQTNYKKVNSELQASNVQAPDQTDLTMAVDSAKRFDINGDPNTPNNGVSIEVTVTNNTSSDIYLSPETLELQDSENSVYEEVSYASSVYSPPSGYVYLADQSIAPKQTVKGALYYAVNDISLNNFTLINGSKTYKVTT